MIINCFKTKVRCFSGSTLDNFSRVGNKNGGKNYFSCSKWDESMQKLAVSQFQQITSGPRSVLLYLKFLPSVVRSATADNNGQRCKKFGTKHFLASALGFFSPSWGPHLLFLSKSACLSFYLYLSSLGFSLFPYVEEFKVSNRAFFSFVPINVLCFSAILNFVCHCN